MKFLGRDLDAYQDDQGQQENGAPGQVAQVHGHGDSVAAGLAKSRRENLDDPKAEGDFWNFVLHCWGYNRDLP